SSRRSPPTATDVAELLSSWAVLVAAGEGTRLGADRPKAFVGLGDEVLLARSLRMLEDHPALDGVVVVVPEGWEEPATLLAGVLRAAYGRAGDRLSAATDCAALVEATGATVTVVTGEHANLKVTTPDDLAEARRRC